MIQVKNLPAKEALTYIKENHCFVLDVRTTREFDEGHIDGAVNIPIHLLPLRQDEIPRDKEVIVYCLHGVRSGNAAHYLLGEGFAKVAHISGGLVGMGQGL